VHPDLVEVQRVGAQLSVGDAAEVVRLAQRRPLEGHRQVIAVGDIHLARLAAPVLLKTLEEPAGQTVFVLLAEAVPADLIEWTDGRALIAAGSPFGAVDHHGLRYEIGQANNALVFPGLGLGVIAARARRVTGGMLLAAARAVADMVDTSAPGAPLLPRVADLRGTSVAVAAAVARAAEAEGVASAPLDADLTGQVRALMWEPRYRPVRAG